MVADPVSITLGALRLFHPIYQAGDELYKSWRRFQTFGTDLEHDQADLEIQYVIFKETSKINIHDLREPIEPENEYHERTLVLRRYLNSIVHRFQACDDIIDEYKPKGTLHCMKERPILL